MKHILYTVKEGGEYRHHPFKYIAAFATEDSETMKMYEKAKKTGILEIKTGDEVVPVPLAYIMLVEDIDNFDFILGRKR